MATEKFSYSLDGSLYEGEYASFEEAVEAAKEAANDEQDRNGEPQEAWVGRIELTPLTDFIDGESILSKISESVEEDLGESYAGFLDDLIWTRREGRSEQSHSSREEFRKERISEFEQLIADWIAQYESADLWRLMSYKKINLEHPEGTNG